MLMKNLKNATCYILWIWPEKTSYHTKQKQIARAARVTQSVIDSFQVITMLIRNLKSFEWKNITQTPVLFEML